MMRVTLRNASWYAFLLFSLMTCASSATGRAERLPLAASYAVKYSDCLERDEPHNHTCILLDAGFQFYLPYETRDGGNASVTVNLPVGDRRAHVTGDCSIDGAPSNATKQRLDVRFAPDGQKVDAADSDLWGVTLWFRKRSDSYFIADARLEYVVAEELFPGAAHKGRQVALTAAPLRMFETHNDLAYMCIAQMPIRLNGSVEIRTSSLLLQAFKQKKSTFEDPDDSCTKLAVDDATVPLPYEQCEADDSNADEAGRLYVYIGVSLATLLGCLVAIWLVARMRMNVIERKRLVDEDDY